MARLLVQCLFCAFIVLSPLDTAVSQSSSAEQLSANDLARAVVANELNAQDKDSSLWMYRVESDEQGRKKTKEVIQTSHGSLELLLAVDGHSLSPQERGDEDQRIERLVRNPTEQAKLEQTKRKDAEECRAFFKMIPDAFNFSYAGQDGGLTKLSVSPNPNFRPPTRQASVFREMEGEMWVHNSEKRLASIRGHLIADVKFGGGFLGYLQKGGEFAVEQRELVPGHWDITLLDVNMQGKALFFKTINVQQKQLRTDVRPVPGSLTLAEAAEMLTKQVLVAANRKRLWASAIPCANVIFLEFLAMLPMSLRAA